MLFRRQHRLCGNDFGRALQSPVPERLVPGVGLGNPSPPCAMKKLRRWPWPRHQFHPPPLRSDTVMAQTSGANGGRIRQAAQRVPGRAVHGGHGRGGVNWLSVRTIFSLLAPVIRTVQHPLRVVLSCKTGFFRRLAAGLRRDFIGRGLSTLGFKSATIRLPQLYRQTKMRLKSIFTNYYYIFNITGGYPAPSKNRTHASYRGIFHR